MHCHGAYAVLQDSVFIEFLIHIGIKKEASFASRPQLKLFQLAEFLD